MSDRRPARGVGGVGCREITVGRREVSVGRKKVSV